MERYQRHITLRDFGLEGQKKLHAAKVLVVGAGGLGVPVLTYLNAMGVGILGIVDGDKVSLGNLHRQVLYDEDQVGQPKTLAALQKLMLQNSATAIDTYPEFLTVKNALEIIKDYDVVVDATDNFPTRYLINDACVMLNKPFVYGALHGFEGQVSVFNYEQGPTYRCLFPTMPKADAIPNCNDHGVLGILPGIIGNFQALEVIKIVTGIGEVLSGKLLLFDALVCQVRHIKFPVVAKNLMRSTLAEDYSLECGLPIKAVGIKEMLDHMKQGSLQLIDVRKQNEFEMGHLEQARNIPLDNLLALMDRINLDVPIYLVCQSGTRSMKAAQIIKSSYPNAIVFNVTGGMGQLESYANNY